MNQWARRVSCDPLVHNAAALYGVQFVRKLLPLIVVPYLARTLGPPGWGIVAFTQSLAEILVLIIEFGFNLSATREIARERESKQICGEIMAGVLGSQVFLALSGMAVTLVASRFIPLLRDEPKLLAAGLFYAIAQGFIPLWFFQGLERMRLAAALEISGRAIGLLSIFLFVRSAADAWVALFIQGVAPAITTCAGLAMAYQVIPCRWPSWALIGAALRRGWPMFLFRSAESLYGVQNSFILGLFATPTQVGYFASAEKISKAAFGLLNPIRDALYPRLSSMARSAPDGAARLARMGVVVMVSGGVLLAGALFAGAPLLVRLLMGAAFEPAVQVLRILAVLPVLLAVTNSAGIQWLIPLGRDADVNRIIFQAGFLNVILALILAPRFAHIGMAWGILSAETFVCCSMVWVAVRSTSLLAKRPSEDACFAEPDAHPEPTR